MIEPLFGVIKHYNGDRQFGFIKPDVVRTDGKDVFFHRNNAGTLEERCGRLEIDSEFSLKREPHKGDRVVYYQSAAQKGPIAFSWALEEEWKKHETEIAKRPRADWRLCRVMTWVTVGERSLPQEVLRAYYPRLVNALIDEPQLLGPIDWIEELRSNGKWERMWDIRHIIERGDRYSEGYLAVVPVLERPAHLIKA